MKIFLSLLLMMITLPSMAQLKATARCPEITDVYKGKMEPAVMGAQRGSLFKFLGNPSIKDDTWDAFITRYGTLILYYNTAGKVNKIQMSSKSADYIKLCN